MVIVINSVIGEFSWVDFTWLAASTVRSQVSDYSQLSDHRCPITANCPIKLFDYTCTEWLVKYKGADAPITFEEIVTVMISLVITVAGFSLGSGTTSAQLVEENSGSAAFESEALRYAGLRNVNIIQSLSTVIFLSDLSLSCAFIKSVYIQL